MSKMRLLEISDDDLFEIQMILDEGADRRGQKLAPERRSLASPANRLRNFRILGTPYREPEHPSAYPVSEDIYIPGPLSAMTRKELWDEYNRSPYYSSRERAAKEELIARGVEWS